MLRGIRPASGGAAPAETDTENRSIIDTLNKGWELLGMLPKDELDRIDTKILDQYYHETTK